ncbi:hypothetical protein J8281_09730 [Aquimarina sp. U1-2]|uniref:hypothetical protein n=1 Tax=Aquimarina sp. U1-2 TaxID=2823141 RepID=UPI001AECB552|nr:hypothetical protein [Aquimarina sp. U1-2]MBP2832462.1 hypothetical protein [Aquimarina sp. U1-2]
MPKLILHFILLFTIHMAFGQKTNEAVLFTQDKQINKFHTIEDLQNLKKGDLIGLYKDRVREIMTVIPLLSLTNEAGVKLSDIGIKEDSRHVKILKNNKETIEKSLVTTYEAIEELVAYADTEKIIWTVLYFEEIIKKMRIGVNGSF